MFVFHRECTNHHAVFNQPSSWIYKTIKPGRGKNHMTSFLLPSNRQAIRIPVCKCGARVTGLPFLPNILFWKDHFKEQSMGNVDNESSLSGVFEFPLMSPWLVLWHYWESQVDVTWIQSSWLMLGWYIHCRDLKPVRKIENEKLTWAEIWVMFTFFFFCFSNNKATIRG